MTIQVWREAAVLVLLSDPTLQSAQSLDSLVEPDVLLTRRALTMRSQPGQVSFPGGTQDAGETAEETALRETHEEIGLDPSKVTVGERLTRLTIPPRRFQIVPVTGTWDGVSPIETLSTDEVDSVHRIPIRELASPDNRSTAIVGEQRFGPMFSVDGLAVWGFTARVIDELLRVRGWEEEWDSERTSIVPPDFRLG